MLRWPSGANGPTEFTRPGRIKPLQPRATHGLTGPASGRTSDRQFLRPPHGAGYPHVRLRLLPDHRDEYEEFFDHQQFCLFCAFAVTVLFDSGSAPAGDTWRAARSVANAAKPNQWRVYEEIVICIYLVRERIDRSVSISRRRMPTDSSPGDRTDGRMSVL